MSTTPSDETIGDVAGEPMLAHEATMAGRLVANIIAGADVTLDDRPVPTAVFTDPEVATVGLTEEEAQEAGHIPAVGKFLLGANGRSLPLGKDDGFVRVVANADTGHLLGAQIVGPEASELIVELTLAVDQGLRVENLAISIHTHPTLTEAVMEASEGVSGMPTQPRVGGLTFPPERNQAEVQQK